MQRLHLGDIVDCLEGVAPSHLQESYDNSGLIFGHRQMEITGAVISLDCTEEIIKEAIELNCNLVISHHPLIFRGIKKLSNIGYVDRCLTLAIKNDIAILALHTNLDNVLRNGVNAKIAEKLKLTDIQVLVPKQKSSRKEPEEIGSGVIGYLRNPMTERDFLEFVKSAMNTDCIRYTSLLGKQVSKVAVCGGSGSHLLPYAIENGADVYVSADFKYHDFFDANHQLVIFDIGHYESEFYTIELIFQIIRDKFPKFAAHCTKQTTNPVNYF